MRRPKTPLPRHPRTTEGRSPRGRLREPAATARLRWTWTGATARVAGRRWSRARSYPLAGKLRDAQPGSDFRPVTSTGPLATDALYSGSTASDLSDLQPALRVSPPARTGHAAPPVHCGGSSELNNSLDHLVRPVRRPAIRPPTSPGHRLRNPSNKGRTREALDVRYHLSANSGR